MAPLAQDFIDYTQRWSAQGPASKVSYAFRQETLAVMDKIIERIALEGKEFYPKVEGASL